MKTKKITKEYTIWCDHCAHWEQESKKAFVKSKIKEGWAVWGDDFYCKDCEEYNE